MKKVFVFVMFSVLFNPLFAQKISIKGKVVDAVDSPLVYFNITLLTYPDTNFQTAGAFDNGIFELKAEKSKAYLLKISAFGYSDKFIKLDARQTEKDLNLGTVKMLKERQLSGIVVKAKLPVFKENGGQTTILVKSTSLSNAGTLTDVLRRSPGVSVDRNNNVSVFGKGKVAIYVDGREIKNNEELSNILSSDISKIVIDKFPGAKYSANVDCVIKITTKKDKTSLSLYNQSVINHTYSNSSGLDLNFSGKNWMNYLTISFGHNKNIFNITDSTKNYREKDNVFFTNSIEQDDIVSQNPDVFYGFNYQISENTDCQLQYSYSQNNSSKNSKTIENIGNNDYTIVHSILSEEKNIDKTHYADIIVNHNFSKSSLSIIGDYVYAYSSAINNLSETNITHNIVIPMLVDSKSIFDVYTLKTDYQTEISKKTNLEIGSKWSLTKNNTNSSLLDEENDVFNYQLSNSLNDRIFAVFTSFNTQLNNFDISGGIRAENIYRYLKNNNQAFLDTSYWKFFPNFLVNYTFKSGMVMSLNYMKKIRRPVFWQLDPSILYFDSLSYRVGNPQLKPYIFDNITFSLSLPNMLNFSLNYYKMNNYALVVATEDDKNPGIMKYMPVNFDHADAYSFSADYTYTAKNYSAYIYVFTQIVDAEIPFNSGYYKTNKPYWYVETDHNFDINKHLNFYLNFIYTSDMYLFSSRQLASYDLSAGILLKFLDNRLTVNVDMNDILHKAVSASYDRYGNYLTYEYFDKDNRFLSIRLKYVFFKSNAEFNPERANDNEISRLK